MALPDLLNALILHKLLIFVYWKRGRSHVLFFLSVRQNFALNVQICCDVGIVNLFICCDFSEEILEPNFWALRIELVLVSVKIAECAGVGGGVSHYFWRTIENFFGPLSYYARTFIYRGLGIQGAPVGCGCCSMIRLIHQGIFIAHSPGFVMIAL